MRWWKDLKAWLLLEEPEKPAKAWNPNDYYVPFPINPPRTQVEWPATEQSGSDAAVTAGPNKITDGESEARSDEKSAAGDGLILPAVWYHAETIEGEPPVSEPLEHADDLPSATYRVFPSAGNHRNSYDTPASVVRALRARWRYLDDARVYRAETVWKDVTAEFVAP